MAVPALGLFHNSQSVLRGGAPSSISTHVPRAPGPLRVGLLGALGRARAARPSAAAATCACVASSAASTAANARSTKLSRPVEGASLSTRAADTFVFASDACAALTCCGVLTRFVSARTAASRATDVALDMRTASFASAADFLALSAAARMLFCVFTSLQWSVPARHGVAMRACVPARKSMRMARRARIAARAALLPLSAPLRPANWLPRAGSASARFPHFGSYQATAARTPRRSLGWTTRRSTTAEAAFAGARGIAALASVVCYPTARVGPRRAVAAMRRLLLLPFYAYAVQNATDSNDCEDPSMIIKRHAWTQTMTLHPRSGHIRRTGGISLFRKNAKASSGWVQKYLEKELVNTTTIATRQHERKLWHDHRHVSYRQLFWVQEALGFDPNCFPTFEHHKVFLATVLRRPLDRAVAAFYAQPSHRERNFGETWEKWSSRGANPPLFLASRMTDNYASCGPSRRGARSTTSLDLETCLRGCPVRREPVTSSDLEAARRALGAST